jgi:predicted ATPase/DNA-binding SARP family transcriptional activator
VPTAPAFPDALLPVPLTGFVGRDQELAAVLALLEDARLLTLTGAGGSGKTRLALAAARDADVPAAWVELASIADPTTLPAHVASVLGARTDAGVTPEQAITGLLQEREILLVLDNCEHVVDICAHLVERLLRACSRLRVLATSREPLGVTGERSWLVPTLALPERGAPLSAAAAGESGAVRLFVERARDAAPGFALTEANVEAVVQICRRLDGLPLALELAAARIAVLTPAQLAARLDDRFAVLSTGPRAATPRQRTLRGTVDWSYELLDEDERILLARLSVFVGGFTLEAAERVCAGGEIPAARVLELLASLASKSLVTMQEQDDGQARYTLLETIREYAGERLRERGGVDAVARQHGEFFRDLVTAVVPDVLLARRAVLQQLDVEHGNIVAALAWSARTRHGTEIGLPLIWGLLWYWHHRQLWREGRAAVEAALDSAESPPPELRAAAMHGRGVFGMHMGDPRAGEWLAEARRLWVEAGEERWLAFTILVSVVAASLNDDWTLARQYADEMVAIASRQPDPWDAALARAHALVPVLNSLGEYEASDAVLDEVVEVFRARDYRTGVAFALDAQSFVALRLGDVARAARLAVASLREDPLAENWWLAGRSLRVLAGVAEARGDLTRAVRLSACAEMLYETVGAARLTAERVMLNELPERLRDRLAPDVHAAAMAEGRAMGLREVVEYAVAGAEVEDAPLPMPARELTTTGALAIPALPAVRAGDGAVGGDEDSRADAPPLDVRTLGRVEIRRAGRLLTDDSWPYAKPRELLLYLLAHPEGRTREQVGLDFWPEISAAQVKNNFHVTLHHLRKALGDNAWVRFERGRYLLAMDAGVHYDAAVFESAARDALKALRAHPDDASAAEVLATVLERYGGAYLEEEDVGDWHLAVRDRLARLHEEATLALGEYLSVEGHHAEAARWFRALLAQDPVHEEAARLLMLSLARDERRGEALRVFEQLQAALRTELDADPGKAVRGIAEAVRTGERV